MTEVVIGENTYVIGKLNAMKQFHLSRRLLPVLQKLLPAFVAMQGVTLESQDVTKIAEVIAPAVDALSALSDSDSEYIISLCLGVVKRKQGNASASVWNEKANAPMFDDLDLATMLRLTWEVIGDNLGSFMQGSGLTALPNQT
jgi:hypothetical protein